MKAKELKSKGAGECVLIDVRTPVEFNIQHIEGAALIPLDEFTEEGFKSACEDDDSEDLQKKVSVLEGGMDAWESAGGDTVEGEGCKIPLERQVLIGAGSIIILAFLLAHVHYIFGYLSLIVAGGLIYAGLTGTCGLAMVLSNMPWNKAPQAKSKCSDTEDCQKG